MSEPLSLDLILIGSVIIFLGLIYLAMRQTGESDKVNQRLQRISKKEKTTEELIENELSLRRQKDTSLDRFGFDQIAERLSNRLQHAGIVMNVKKYVIICAVAMAVIALLFAFILNKSILLGLLVGFVFGFGVPHVIVGMRIKRSKSGFLKLFPDAIELIVRGLRAGLPVTESMQNVAKEIPAPLAPIFQEICDQVALGVPFERAMEKVADDLDLTEFKFFVISVILQRETGGNLGEILSNLAEVLRSRHILKLKIRAMSSEARASAYIVGALPFLVLGALLYVTPDYLTPMIEDTRGNLAALGALAMMATGMFIMSRMAKFKV